MKSRKTYSLMIKYKDKAHFVRALDYDGGYIIRLTEKSTSAKKWKTIKGLTSTIISLINNSRTIIKLGIEKLNLPNGVWYNILNEYVGELEDKKSEIFNELKIFVKSLKSNSSTRNVQDAKNKVFEQFNSLDDISMKLDSYRQLRGNKQGSKFKIIDSSHNFRKYKLEQINKSII